MQKKSIPIFVSSDAAAGAFNISPGIDRFSIQFKNTLEIPPEAANVTLGVVSSTIWWTVKNITSANNQFRFLISGDPGSPFDITIEEGLYDVFNLNAAINRELINAGVASGLLTITGDSASQKIVINLDIAGLRVEWIAGSMFELTGFNAGQFVPAAGFTTGQFSELAPNVANFSDVSSFLLGSDLVTRGIPVGNQERQVIANPLINVPPGSQINFSPDNIIRIPAQNLAGKNTNQAQFFITDQLGRALDFNGEDFTVLFEIQWNVFR